MHLQLGIGVVHALKILLQFFNRKMNDSELILLFHKADPSILGV